MPIYEYRCEACGHTLDWLQKVSDPPLSECPSCNKGALKRLISAPSFRLKGSGWYETDFKADKRRNLVESGDSGGTTKDGEKSKGDEKKPSDEKATKKSDDKGKAKPDKKSGTGSEAA